MSLLFRPQVVPWPDTRDDAGLRHDRRPWKTDDANVAAVLQFQWNLSVAVGSLHYTSSMFDRFSREGQSPAPVASPLCKVEPPGLVDRKKAPQLVIRY